MTDPAPAVGVGGQVAATSWDGRSLALDFPVRIGALAWAQGRAAHFLRGHGLAERLVGRVELLVEELTTNVINHGAVADPAACLRLTLTAEPDGGCHVVFEDPGQPFNPITVALPERPSRLEEARIGGLGLVLLRQMARNPIHEVLPGGGNRLTFRLDPSG